MGDPLATATEAIVTATWALVGVAAVQLFVNVALWYTTNRQAKAAIIAAETTRRHLSASEPV